MRSVYDCRHLQELLAAWEKIARMEDMDHQVIAVSRDIKTRLQSFYTKMDESSQLNSEVYRGYGLKFIVTHDNLPMALS